MKALITHNKIIIKQSLMKSSDKRLYVLMKKALESHCEPICYTNLEVGKKSYELPCPRKNIVSLYIK